MQYYLPLAAHKSDRDIEYVHQLRVATRRAMAAVSIFQPLLSARKAAWLDKQLTRVRRAAGDAQDSMSSAAGSPRGCRSSPRVRALRCWSRFRRYARNAQRPVLKAHAGLERRHFGRRVKKLLTRIRCGEYGAARVEPSFAASARQFLGETVHDFFLAGTCDPHDAEAVHRFRIIGKQLRYSMEVFAGAFDAEFRGSLYPLIEELQEKLGEMNDHVTAIERFTTWQREWNDPRLNQPLAELLAAEQAGSSSRESGSSRGGRTSEPRNCDRTSTSPSRRGRPSAKRRPLETAAGPTRWKAPLGI